MAEPSDPSDRTRASDGDVGASDRALYRYRSDVLDAVSRHGIRPTSRTPPELARGFVRELYKYEIRRLRERYLRHEFSKQEYSVRVEQLRKRYPVLALVPSMWLEPK